MFLTVALLISAQSAHISNDIKNRDSAQIDSRESKLEKAVASEEWLELGTLLKNPADRQEFDNDLMWLQRKTFAGSSAFLSLSYGAGLWHMASAISDEPQKRQVQGTALAMHLYAIALVNIDGPQCVDKTAPLHRMDQLMSYTPGIWDFAASMSDAERAQVMQIVLVLEQKTAAKRLESGDANFLCRDGMSQIAFGLANGTTKEVESQPGQFGRQINVDDGGKYKPEVVSKEEWGKVAATRRAGLKDAINAILDVRKPVKE